MFFSDAVVAIAITLLALEIHLPDLRTASDIPEALVKLWPQYFGYAISFLVVGSFWYGHHRMFRVVGRYDDVLLWLDLLFLLCIAFIPFASSVLGDYPGERSAVVFYSVVMITTGLVENLLWAYATYAHRLIGSSVSERTIRIQTLRNLMPPVVFALALPLTFISPYLAFAAWLAIYVILMLLLRVERRPLTASAPTDEE
ncbi:MAG: DUF1211 domain-containing protein [Chloroflexi bacterium]|nr:DUF1211 domain-containing protein [Chloroflexota bacterium]